MPPSHMLLLLGSQLKPFSVTVNILQPCRRGEPVTSGCNLKPYADTGCHWLPLSSFEATPHQFQGHQHLAITILPGSFPSGHISYLQICVSDPFLLPSLHCSTSMMYTEMALFNQEQHLYAQQLLFARFFIQLEHV